MQASSPEQFMPAQSAGEKAILEAAVRLFSDKGFNGVSMRSVAAAAGVSKANIYHHFESKEALYLAILHASAANLSMLIENLAEHSGNFDLKITEFAADHLEHLIGNATSSRLMLREAFSGDDERSRILVDKVVGGLFERIVSIFRSGQEAGAIRSDLDPALCATLLMGADLFYFQAQGVLRHLPDASFAMQPGRFSSEMADILLNGMLSKTAEEGGRS